jgi:hypothetical protein
VIHVEVVEDSEFKGFDCSVAVLLSLFELVNLLLQAGHHEAVFGL